MTKFADKSVMITGATGGVGQVVAHRFAAEGANLILLGRSQDKLMALAEALPTTTSPILDTADVTDPGQVEALIQRLESGNGRVDVLIHTVGGYAAGKPVHETSIDTWERMINMNARAVFVTCGRVARHMVERQIAGNIVAILAKPAFKGAKNSAAYSASKAAALRIIESMAAELVDHQINVNGIVPSVIDTALNRKAMPNANFNRWVTPNQLVDAMMFLASDDAARIRGVALEIYG